MIVAPGATSNIVTIQIVDDSGLAVTGLVAATFPSVYFSLNTNAASTQITPLSDLALITTAFTAKGVKEREGGYYRIDVPDAAFTTAGTVRIEGEASGKHVLCEPIIVSYLPANVLQWLTATAPANTGDAFARLGAPAGANVSADVAAIKSDTGTILTDVNSGAGAIYTRLGAPTGASIAADIAQVETHAANIDTQVGTAGVGLTNLGDTRIAKLDQNISTILTTAMTEAYAANGAAPTLAQAIFLIQQTLTEFAIAGTTVTIKKKDHATTAATLTLDSATTPTQATRAT